MQNRYAGDIGDYIKLGLLRALSPGRSLGVAWYLYPNESHNADGRHVSYLADPNFWRSLDPDLFDALSGVVQSGRSVGAIESSAVLSAQFHSEHALRAPSDKITHDAFRQGWFCRLSAALSSCDLVFADPDNGLVDDAPERRRAAKYGKQLPLQEALALAHGRTAVFYHHNSRFKGGHDLEVNHWMDRLGGGTIAVRANAYSCRTFFIVNPDTETVRRAAAFCDRWSRAKVRLHSAQSAKH